MRLVSLLASAAFVTAEGVAHAQQPALPPPQSQSQPEETAEDEIVVLAESGDQVRIDRRTYTLRDDAAAQSTNMFDVLGRIPSVAVAPSGAVTLLGASNVTIQINGEPIPGANLEQVLRGLPGAEVERVEVITNPSAQYSAQASGGIINIITRSRFESGFSGTLQASVDDVGGYHVGFAPSWSRGPWALSGQVGVHGGSGENILDRSRETFPAGAFTTEQGGRVAEFEGLYANRLQAAYRFDERRRMSLSLDAGVADFNQEQRSDVADGTGPLSTRITRSQNSNENRQLFFDLQQSGDTPRELLRLNVALSHFDNSSRSLFATAPALGSSSSYATTAMQETARLSIKLDSEQPMPSERFLTFGAAFEQSDQTIENALDLIAGAGPSAYEARLAGIAQTSAAYATFQFSAGDWTWQPGLRMEQYRREVRSAGLETDSDDPRLFPSIHIRRELGENLDLDLSYTSRIQRPFLQQLDPALRFVDVNRAISGNPDLQPTTTDAYEANLVYQRGRRTYNATFYDRINQDIVSQFTQLTSEGVFLPTQVNAGVSEQRGIQAQLRGPLGTRWRYSLTGNVLNREFDFLANGVLARRSEMEYDGVALLEYRDADQDAIGADQRSSRYASRDRDLHCKAKPMNSWRRTSPGVGG